MIFVSNKDLCVLLLAFVSKTLTQNSKLHSNTMVTCILVHFLNLAVILS